MIQVELHTSIQLQTPRGPVCCLELTLANNATVADVLRQLQIGLEPEDLLLVVNRKVVEPEHMLKNGDRLDLIPAMSGGSAKI